MVSVFGVILVKIKIISVSVLVVIVILRLLYRWILMIVVICVVVILIKLLLIKIRLISLLGWFNSLLMCFVVWWFFLVRWCRWMWLIDIILVLELEK